MEINITLSQIWHSASIRDFVMRSQAQRELEKLLEKVEDEEDALETLDAHIYAYYDGDFDTFEEELYSGDFHEIAEAAGIELTEDEEEDEEEETELYSVWVGDGEITDNYMEDYDEAVELAKVWRDEKGHKDTCIEVVNEDGDHKRFIAEF